MNIYIIDIGCYVRLQVFSGKATVIDSGGCDPLFVLAGIDYSLPQKELASQILEKWKIGYDGDPHEAGVQVIVDDMKVKA